MNYYIHITDIDDTYTMEAKDQRKTEKTLKLIFNTYIYGRIAQIAENDEKDTKDFITYALIKENKAGDRDFAGGKRYKNVFTIGPHISQFLRMMFEKLLYDVEGFRGMNIPMTAFVNDLNNTECAAWLIPPYLYNITVSGCDVRCDTTLLSSYLKNVIDLPLAEICMRHFDRLLIHLGFIIGSIISAHSQPLNDRLFIGALNMISMDPSIIDDMLANMREPKKKVTKKEELPTDKLEIEKKENDTTIKNPEVTA